MNQKKTIVSKKERIFKVREQQTKIIKTYQQKLLMLLSLRKNPKSI